MCTDLVTFRIKEKVGPVWISLHVLELKKLPQAQDEDLLTNLTKIERKLKSIKGSVEYVGTVGELSGGSRTPGLLLAVSTSFLSSCGRSVARSRGKPGTRVVVRT